MFRKSTSAVLGGALALAALASGARAGALEADLSITPDGDLFPALDLSQAPRGANASGSGLVRVRVRASDAPRDVRVTVTTEGLRAPAIVDVHVDRADADVEARPRLDWDIGAVRDLRTPRRQRLRVMLESAGVAPLVETREIRLHPLDEALYFVREGDARVDLGWAFAAYVSPHDAVVDTLVAEARRSGFSDRFDGYAGGEDAVLRQALALWAALDTRGLRYSNASPALARGPHVYSQRVRLLADAWNERVANCLDGSVLIASALERLGIRSSIVLVPGHAFVGFRLDAGGARNEYLETTLLGARVGKAAKVDYLDVGAPAVRDDAHTRQLATFEGARRAGRARFAQAASKLDGRHRPDYSVIDIATARAYGIVPIALDSGDATGTDSSTQRAR